MKHLSDTERSEIYILKWRGYSDVEIGEVLWRDRTTIRRERKRNKVKWMYDPKKAKQKAYQRRRSRLHEIKKIRKYSKLEAYIHEKLKEKRTPELIAGRWNSEYGEKEWVTICFKTIYKYIYGRFWGGLWQYLYLKRVRPKKRSWKKWKRQLIPNRTWIDSRPHIIGWLLAFGHYEADLFVWPKWTKEVVLTLTEKVSRLKIAVRVETKSPVEVTKKLQQIVKEYGVKSITFDNWVEFMYHEQLWIPTYFCHPYHSREKWQVEYTNKLYRMFIPKWSKIAKRSQKQLDEITKNLNNRPMKCLNYKTPLEVYLSNFSLLPFVAIDPTM